MKITTEIEITWLDNEGNLDRAVEQQLLTALTNTIQNDFLKHAGAKLAARAEKIIMAKTEFLIDSILEQPVVISDGWQKKEEYPSILDMVEQKMTALYEGKLQSKGGTCEKDPVLIKIENVVQNETTRRLKVIEDHIQKRAAGIAKKTINNSKLAKTLKVVIDTGQYGKVVAKDAPAKG